MNQRGITFFNCILRLVFGRYLPIKNQNIFYIFNDNPKVRQNMFILRINLHQLSEQKALGSNIFSINKINFVPLQLKTFITFYYYHLI